MKTGIFTPDQLRVKALEIIEKEGLKRYEVGERIGRSKGQISRALNAEGTEGWIVIADIFKHFRGVTIYKQPYFIWELPENE